MGSLKDFIKILLIKSNKSLTDVSRIMSERNNTNISVQNLNGKLTRETLKYTEAQEIADIIGYEIQWVKKDT